MVGRESLDCLWGGGVRLEPSTPPRLETPEIEATRYEKSFVRPRMYVERRFDVTEKPPLPQFYLG